MAKRKRLSPTPASGAGSASEASSAPQSGLEVKSFGSGPSAPSGAATRPPIAHVAGEAAGEAALRKLAADVQAARDTGRLVVELPLDQIAPDHLLRDRLALEGEEMAALKASLRAHGQRVPADVTPLEGTPPYGLISGWRRYRALSELYAETGDARFSKLRALIRPAAEASETYVAMVEENEIRAGISYYERARLVAAATDAGVFGSESEALRTLFAAASRAKRSKIGSFVALHRGVGDLLDHPAQIGERLGLALAERVKSGGAGALRAALETGRPRGPEAEAALLSRLAKPPAPSADVSRAKQSRTGAGQKRLRTRMGGMAVEVAQGAGEITIALRGPQADGALAARLHDLLKAELG